MHNLYHLALQILCHYARVLMAEHALSMEIYSMKCEITLEDTFRAFALARHVELKWFRDLVTY